MSTQPTPDIIARLDQLGATLKAFAVPLGGFMNSLLETGFTREEAFDLVLAQLELMQVKAIPEEPPE